MSISPDPGSSLPREDSPRHEAYQRPAPPPPVAPPPPPQGYSYAPPPPPPPPPPQEYAPHPGYAPPAYTQTGYSQPMYGQALPPENNAKWFPPVVIVALVILAGALIFVVRDQNTTSHALQVQLVEMKEHQDAMRHELDAISEKNSRLKEDINTAASTLTKRLGSTEHQVQEAKQTEASLAEQQKQQAQQSAALGQQISSVRDESATKISAVNSEVGGVKTDVAATRKDLDATKNQLQKAMGDLGVQSGLIAHNHDELTELKKRNERNYYEFNITKSKQLNKVGDISIRLTKADAKKGKFTLEVQADDKLVEKKDRTVNEPLQFYMSRSRGIPYELVVNQVDKDKIVGYLATPK